MNLGMPTVGVSPGTYTMRLGCPGLGCADPPNHYVFDPITGSANNEAGFPGDHAVGYYPHSLGDAASSKWYGAAYDTVTSEACPPGTVPNGPYGTCIPIDTSCPSGSAPNGPYGMCIPIAAGGPMTLFGVRVDILGVVAGAAILGAILFGKYVAK